MNFIQNNIGMILLCSLLGTVLLWPLFVFTMGIERARKANQVSKIAWCLASPFLAVALVLDFLLNISVFIIATLDIPQRGEWLFSQRLNRLAIRSDWRGRFAIWLAQNLLNPYDPTGEHIKGTAVGTVYHIVGVQPVEPFK